MLDFLEQILEELPFPLQRLQTYNGTEFLAYKVRDYLLDQRIKQRPIPSRTPHLNGKVRRAQKTVLDEFYATNTLGRPTLADDLGVLAAGLQLSPRAWVTGHDTNAAICPTGKRDSLLG